MVKKILIGIKNMKTPGNVVVSIDMSTENSIFHKMSATQKIEHLKKQIEQIYTAFMEKHSDCQLIIIWPEYGVYNPATFNGPLESTISKKDDEFLKKIMMDLTKKYNNLCIIGGVSVDDKVTGRDHVIKKLAETLDFYTTNLELIYELKLNIYEGCYIAQIDRLKQLILHCSSLVFTSNECRVYSKGLESSRGKLYSTQQEIWRQADRGNATSEKPTDEMDKTDYVLQPGGKDSPSPLMKIAGLPCGVELCFEHVINLLPGMVEERKLDRPVVQFVISDDCDLFTNNNCASYGLIKNCKTDGTQFILSRGNETPEKSIPVYLIQVDEEKVSLNRTIPTVYPFQYKILDSIEKELKSKESPALQSLKSRFEDRPFNAFTIENDDCLELLALFEEIKDTYPTLHRDLFRILNTESAKRQFRFKKDSFKDGHSRMFFIMLNIITHQRDEGLLTFLKIFPELGGIMMRNHFFVAQAADAFVFGDFSELSGRFGVKRIEFR